MGTKSNVGGCAALSGIIFINSTTGRVVRGFKDKNGSPVTKELALLTKVLTFYKARFEGPLKKIPLLRELFKVLLMFVVSGYSFFTGLAEFFSFRGKGNIRKSALIALAFTLLYNFEFVGTFYTIILLALLLILAANEIGSIRKYHGAEHKVINMYESIDDISLANVEAARSFSRIHRRCGTNFLVLLLPFTVVSTLAEYLLPPYRSVVLDMLITVLLLVIAMEIFKLLLKRNSGWLIKAGGFLQKNFTTKEPGDLELEVAVNALKFCEMVV